MILDSLSYLGKIEPRSKGSLNPMLLRWLSDFTEFCFRVKRGIKNPLFWMASHLAKKTTTFKRVVENDVTLLIARFYRVLF